MYRISLVIALGLTAVLAAQSTTGPDSSSRLDGSSRPADQVEQRFRGFVVPSRQVELNAPLEDILKEIVVEEADRVEAGQLLARMDDRLQSVVVDAAHVRAESTSAVRRAELDVEEAQLNLERTEDAFRNGAATDLEVRRTKIALGQAEAALAAAKENQTLEAANLSLEEQRLERYRIRAPFDGTIVRVIAESGAMMQLQDRVLQMADLDTLEANIHLPVELYGALQVGKAYTLRAGEPVNADLPATLKTISPIIDTASQTFLCVLTIDNPKATLPAGFTVHLPWPQD